MGTMKFSSWKQRPLIHKSRKGVLLLRVVLISVIESSVQLNIAHNSLNELTKYSHTKLEDMKSSFKRGLHEVKELLRELEDQKRRM